MLSAEDVAYALAGPRRPQKSGDGWLTWCPVHTDLNPSLSVSEKDGKLLVKCFGGCPQEAVVAALKDRDLWPDAKQRHGEGTRTSGERWNRGTGGRKSANGGGSGGSTTGSTPKSKMEPGTGLTLAELAAAKKLPLDLLRGLGLADQKFKGSPRVVIPYMTEAGEVAAIRYRLSLDGPKRFIWRKGDRVMLYGLWQLREIREAGWCLLVEGESDCWTCWHHGLPALGLPGVSTWRSEWSEKLKGRVFLWQEPDEAGKALPAKVGKDLPDLLVIRPPDGLKDLSQAHLQGEDIPALVERLKAQAVPAATLIKEQQDARLKELREAARPVLEHPDPLALFAEEVRERYGGDLTPVLIAYLAATSRLLAMRRGSMPVHLLVLNQSSAGKNYTLQTALDFMPPEAVYVIDAGSPRVLIYDDADLQHRAVVFSEADSLPAGEDNPAASAIRNLLQDHNLHYKVTVRDPETGQYTVREVNKPGPTVLLTTSTRRLGPQLDSRLFSIEVKDDPPHIREVLLFQGRLEEAGPPADPGLPLVAFQAYLQALAPWQVFLPFARPLAAEIGKSANSPRIYRDFARLLSLVKAVALLRHQHRDRDTAGRLLATVEDYATAFNLIAPMYEFTITGASEGVRQVVEAVKELGGGVTAAAVARHLGVGKNTAWRRARTALAHGWLINRESRKSYPAVLELGEPLPDRVGLPPPDRFRFQTVKTGGTEGGTVQDADITEETGEGSTVPPFTGDIFPPSILSKEAQPSDYPLLFAWHPDRQRQAAAKVRQDLAHLDPGLLEGLEEIEL
jgi:hypothetical protein